MLYLSCKIPKERNTPPPHDCCSDKYLYDALESDGFHLLGCDILQPGGHKSVFQRNFTASFIKVGHLPWGWNWQYHSKPGTLLEDYVTSQSRRQQSLQSPMSEPKISQTRPFYFQILKVQKRVGMGHFILQGSHFIRQGSIAYLHVYPHLSSFSF